MPVLYAVVGRVLRPPTVLIPLTLKSSYTLRDAAKNLFLIMTQSQVGADIVAKIYCIYT